VVPPDKSLYDRGIANLERGQFIIARLSLQTLINTYPDSEKAEEAVFAMANSYYEEGGTENLLQAEDGFKNFIIFYPASPKAEDAQLKIIALLTRMMRSPDRDQQYSLKALKEIQRFMQLYPKSKFVPIVRNWDKEAKDRLARHDLMIGQFYEDTENYPGALGRYSEIPEKYPNFSNMDEVLFRMAASFEKAKRPEEAAVCLAQIVKGHSYSKYFKEAKMRLNAMEKPVPETDEALAKKNQDNRPPSKSFAPWTPFIDFVEATGLKPLPDRYDLAVKEADKIAAIEAKPAPAAPANNTAGSEKLITVVIDKDASGNTTTKVESSNPGGIAPKDEAGKKTPPRYYKKPPPKKTP